MRGGNWYELPVVELRGQYYVLVLKRLMRVCDLVWRAYERHPMFGEVVEHVGHSLDDSLDNLQLRDTLGRQANRTAKKGVKKIRKRLSPAPSISLGAALGLATVTLATLTGASKTNDGLVVRKVVETTEAATGTDSTEETESEPVHGERTSDRGGDDKSNQSTNNQTKSNQNEKQSSTESSGGDTGKSDGSGSSETAGGSTPGNDSNQQKTTTTNLTPAIDFTTDPPMPGGSDAILTPVPSDPLGEQDESVTPFDLDSAPPSNPVPLGGGGGGGGGPIAPNQVIPVPEPNGGLFALLTWIGGIWLWRKVTGVKSRIDGT